MATNSSLDTSWREVRYAFRGLLRRPAFTLAAVLTLALGLGATTAIFTFVNEVRDAVWSVNSSLPVFLVRTMQDLYAGSLARASFTLVMLAIAGAMALGLGIVGIAGVMAYVVSQRAREIGIRVALGAEPSRVKSMFVLHGLSLAAVGVVIGLAAAVALTRYMESLLYGVTPLDVPTYAAALALVLAAAALASYLPARRAATISPVETLKAE